MFLAPELQGMSYGVATRLFRSSLATRLLARSERSIHLSKSFHQPDTKAKINSEFDSKILNEEWDKVRTDQSWSAGATRVAVPSVPSHATPKYRTVLLKRHQQRETDAAVQEAEAKHQMEALNVKAKAVHSRLDEMTDKIKSEIADLEVELEHDVDRLSAKFEGSASGGSANCIDARAELNSCYMTLKDSGECHIFAKKLEKCVTTRIT